ncbi:MAG: glutathione synthase [Armatimonadota bacterium]
MRIAFVINGIQTEQPRYTTMLLAWTAQRRGHEVFVLEVDCFTYFPDGSVGGQAIQPARKPPRRVDDFTAALKERDAKRVTISSRDLDVLFIRYNPVDELEERPWAQIAPIGFAQLAERDGVLVLPDPVSLWNNIDKLYFQQLPESVRPKTLITRDHQEILRFWEGCGHKAVIKPLQGFGGSDVFLLKNDRTNLNQMVEAVTRSGYVLAQEYLPAAAAGDVRLFMLNGKPLERDGKIALFRRVNQGDDLRSNMTAGGHPEREEVSPELLHLAEAVGPLLVRDGAFLVGLDIAGQKLMEINVISPGGLYSASTLNDTPFAETVVDAIERKVEYRRLYGSALSNREVACMA